MASYDADIRPLFRERDRGAMLSRFDLWSYDDVKANADAILGRLAAGSMPCDGAQPMTAEDAERFGEVVVVSIPLGRYREVPTDAVEGKVVIDTNNYYPQRDGDIPELDDDSTTSSELLQTHLPGARVVKAFNAIVWTKLRDDGRPAGDPDRLGIPISGDDEQAKRTVAELIDEIGFDAVDAGTLAEGGRKHKVGAAAYTQGLPTAELRARLAG